MTSNQEYEWLQKLIGAKREPSNGRNKINKNNTVHCYLQHQGKPQYSGKKYCRCSAQGDKIVFAVHVQEIERRLIRPGENLQWERNDKSQKQWCFP